MKGAINAPVPRSVTSLNSGRVPVAVHPFSRPAENAPFSPPPKSQQAPMAASGFFAVNSVLN
ncbi:hypothetical protein ACU4GI_34120 [Cupriavidus basilensis]